MTLNCLHCRKPYEQKRRRASHFCEPCRKEINRVKTQARMQELRTLEDQMSELISAYVDDYGMDADYARESIYPRLDEYIADMGIKEGDALPLVPDRMPSGSNSPAGPDEGTSTYWLDLREELEYRSAQTAKHPWFEASPHWSYNVHDRGDLAIVKAA